MTANADDLNGIDGLEQYGDRLNEIMKLQPVEDRIALKSTKSHFFFIEQEFASCYRLSLREKKLIQLSSDHLRTNPDLPRTIQPFNIALFAFDGPERVDGERRTFCTEYELAGIESIDALFTSLKGGKFSELRFENFNAERNAEFLSQVEHFAKNAVNFNINCPQNILLRLPTLANCAEVVGMLKRVQPEKLETIRIRKTIDLGEDDFDNNLAFLASNTKELIFEKVLNDNEIFVTKDFGESNCVYLLHVRRLQQLKIMMAQVKSDWLLGVYRFTCLAMTMYGLQNRILGREFAFLGPPEAENNDERHEMFWSFDCPDNKTCRIKMEYSRIMSKFIVKMSVH